MYKTTQEFFSEGLNQEISECDCYEVAETCTGRFLEIRKEAYAQAMEKTASLSLPAIKPSVVNLGQKINTEYVRIYASLNAPTNVAHNSIKWLRMASVSYALTWRGWVAEGLKTDNEIAKKMALALGAKNIDGLATAFYYDMNNGNDPNAAMEISGGFGYFDTYDQLDHYALALVWFCEADTLMVNGDVIAALDKIADAFYAIGHGIFNLIWSEGRKNANEKNFYVAQKKALKRHAKTYALRDEIIAYWRDNIDPEETNDSAAEILHRHYPAVAHRTLSKYVAAAKKLPPAGIL